MKRWTRRRGRRPLWRGLAGTRLLTSDAAAAGKPPKEPLESGPLVAAARDLIAPEAGSAYAQRYHAALQELPEAVLAHRDLVVVAEAAAAGV